VSSAGALTATRRSAANVVYLKVRKPHGRVFGLAESKSEAEAWAEDCLWYWKTWYVPYGRGIPPMLVGDADTISRKLENVSRHVKSNEVFLQFGQGILDRDKCLKTLELFAEKVMPRFRG